MDRPDVTNFNTTRIQFESFSLKHPIANIKTSAKNDGFELGTYLLEATEKTTVITNCATLLGNSNNLDIQFEILRCFRRLTSYNLNMTMILADRVVEKVVTLLYNANMASVVIEILWNCLDSERCFSVASILAQGNELTKINEFFERITTKGSKQAEKQLRNEIVILFAKIVELYPESNEQFQFTGTQETILKFLTCNKKKTELFKNNSREFVLVFFVYVDQRN